MDIQKLAITIAGIDATSNMFGKIGTNLTKLKASFKDLWSQGDKAAALKKGFGWTAASAASASAVLGTVTGIPGQISKLASAQDGFNQVQILTNKSAEEMKAFRAQIHQISAETGQGFEEILSAATQKIRRGMSEADIFQTLKQEGTYATATHSKNLAQISDATHVFARQMKMSIGDASKAFAGILDISKKGQMDFESLMGQASALMGEASALGLEGRKGMMQVMAAAQFASKDEGPEAAAGSVQALLADLKTAKAEKSFANFGIDFDELNEEALASGNYITHITQEVGKLVKNADGSINEIKLNKLFKSDSSRSLIRSLTGDIQGYEEMWRNAFGADGSQVAKDHETSMKSISQQWKLFQNQMLQVGDSNVTPLLEKLTGVMRWFTKDTWLAKTAVNAFLGLTAVSLIAKLGSPAISVGKSIWGVGKSAVTAATSTYKFIAANAMAIKQHGLGFWANSQLPGLSKATTAVWGFVKAVGAKTAAWAKTAAMKTGSFFTSIAGGLKTASLATWGFVKALIAQAAAWAMTPIGMITIAVTALVTGAVLIWKNWSKVTAWFKGAWAWFSNLWAGMPGWLKWCFPIVNITMIIIKNWSSVTGWFKSAWAWFSGLWSGTSNWIRYLNPIINITAVIVRSWNKVKSFFSNFGKPIIGAFMGVLNFFTGIRQKLLNIGMNIIKNIVAGILSKITAPVDAIKGMVGKVRKLLPFSPAKEGPLKDLHQLKFSETIAQAIKPAPLLTKFTGVFGKIKENMPNTLAKAAQFTAGAIAPLAATAKLAAAPLAALAPQPAQPIQITINIDARGAAPGTEHDLRKAVMAMVPQIERALEQSAARKARVKH